MSPQQAIQAAARHLADAGVPDALHDAAALLASLTGQVPLRLRTDRDTVLSAEVLEAYREIIVQRAKRIPLQHLLGSAWFCGREFEVTPDVLIPRWETELLVERACTHAGAGPIVEVGAGSGCVSISICLQTGMAVTATDLSPAAIAVARRNAQRHGVDQRVLFLCADGLTPFRESGKLGMVVSNPPYIPSEVCRTLQPEVLHDPLLALDGGADGLSVLRVLITDAPGALRPGGWLVMEIGSDQAAAVTALIRKQKDFSEPRVLQDEAGRDRVVEVQKVAEQHASPV